MDCPSRIVDASCTHAALLPRLFGTMLRTADRPALFIKLSGERLEGAAYLSQSGLDGSFLFDLFVPPAGEFRQEAPILVSHVQRAARRHGASRLRLARDLEDPDQIALFDRLGFERVSVQHEIRFDLRQGLERAQRLQARLARRAPAGTPRVLPYWAPYLREVEALCHARFGGLLTGHLLAREGETRDGTDVSCSNVVESGGRLIWSAAVLARDGFARFDPFLVPDVPNWMAGAALGAEVTFRRLLAIGCTTAGGATPASFRPMLRFLERYLGAETAGKRVTFATVLA